MQAPRLARALLGHAGLLSVAFAQAEPKKVVSPEVHADRRVTFRVRAPKASEVKLWGEWIPKYNTFETMTRAHDGVWSATVGPVAPSIYSYLYLVDGIPVIDPSNPRVLTGREGVEGNLVEIRGGTPQPYEPRGAAAGVVHLHSYQSSTGLGARRVVIYTPPDYEQRQGSRYPVLYLMHGSGDTEMEWTSIGRANVIADNLIAEGRARPMILVMPNGHASAPGGEDVPPARLKERIEQDLLKDVIPLVESRYRTLPTKAGRAIAGLSMGAFQALWHGLDHPQMFSGIGVFSGGLFDAAGEEQVARFASDQRAPARRLEHLWIAVGDRDMNVSLARKLDAALTKHNVAHRYEVVAGGGHNWPFWRQCLADFLPLLFQRAR